MRKILVIGASGQIGSELVPELRRKYGTENVIASDKEGNISDFVIPLDVLNKELISKAIEENEINTIFNLASILSASGEKNPLKAWDINLNGLLNVLEISKDHNIDRIIWPSSIAAFGPSTPRINTPNETILDPNTIYGITKVTGELLASYYFKKYNLDIRSVRLPGIISSEIYPKGGTTDYAVEIFYSAIVDKKYTCFVDKDTVLPMMYITDCIKCLIDLLEADVSNIQRRVYNVTSMSFSVEELANEIKKHIPDFKINYKPDFRQEIADSWPKTINDSLAREEWGWKPQYDLEMMTKDMIKKLSKRL
ncbi:MAG: NAD-dependent epimerase/dehydratase family protein [Candidatus Lokiarchaeota archaeon]|nr:NAD-dependent epimerase/dehydratase family protein [Candidatus Lokiarchaeota archaeon]